MKKLVFLIAAQIAAILPATAIAQTPVTIKSEVLVARVVTDEKGNKKNMLVQPTRVLPGEPLAIIISYVNGSAKPATNFVINNPVPEAVTYTGVAESWALVSVDRGKTFGPLAALKVPVAGGKPRPAQVSDVTAVRWKIAQPIAPGASGKVMFYGTVK